MDGLTSTATARPLAEPSALDHVVELTRSRDRGLVEESLISALVDLVDAREVTIWRLDPSGAADASAADVAQRGSWQRVTRRLAQTGDTASNPATAEATDATDAPAASRPEHLRCLREQVRVDVGQDLAGLHHVLLPMDSELEGGGVIELVLAQPIEPRDMRVATSMLRIHANFMHLLDYSERDTLTGLLNRKSFDETFLKATVLEARRQFAADGEQRRQGQPRHPYLGVIDVDHFKRVNDVHGHLIGDEVLVLVARIMRSALRSEDRLYRFGGEEFVVMLDASDDEGARAAFERLRLAVAAYEFPRAGHVTVSVGYVDVRPGDTPQAAFSRADTGVYHAKAHGRDQVVAYAALVAAGTVTESDGENDIVLF
ncbi:GGDEF domain-containing protein [Leptothrix discophora]|uniref:diguanylate cyclase n=1 Tax=Leptothrix discophora TaxID=89 RepID=A0ABT9G5B1_LEPDI|nr:GGDEF domain-containing protein [Leptothrix discophora]MDP4301685.1 GGDEF domain-containing protein [Leptothrix discophora]